MLATGSELVQLPRQILSTTNYAFAVGVMYHSVLEMDMRYEMTIATFSLWLLHSSLSLRVAARVVSLL